MILGKMSESREVKLLKIRIFTCLVCSEQSRGRKDLMCKKMEKKPHNPHYPIKLCKNVILI